MTAQKFDKKPTLSTTKKRTASVTSRSRRKRKTQRRPYRARALAAIAEYPYRKNAVESARGKRTRELERTARFVDRIDRALAMLTAEERAILLDKSTPLPNGTSPTGFDRYERAACEKSTYYRMRSRALDRFSLALFGAI